MCSRVFTNRFAEYVLISVLLLGIFIGLLLDYFVLKTSLVVNNICFLLIIILYDDYVHLQYLRKYYLMINRTLTAALMPSWFFIVISRSVLLLIGNKLRLFIYKYVHYVKYLLYERINAYRLLVL